MANFCGKSLRILEKLSQTANRLEGKTFSVKSLRSISASVQHSSANVKTTVPPTGQDAVNGEQRVLRKDVCFDDYRNAFNGKTFGEMSRALFVLKLCSFNSIVNNSLQLMTASEKIFGEKTFSRLMKRTMYGQFVAGEDPISIQETTKKLKQSGIGSMLAIPMEEDVEVGCHELRYAANLESILRCIELSAKLDQEYPMMQLKVTGLLSADLSPQFGFPQHYGKG